ncbi:MAG TPA: hypothetical protein VGX70_11405 [Gemmataceae bacterium]|jgi:hypothetical protein|nr:hypothetical protein [Gemmataceae bacterium]
MASFKSNGRNRRVKQLPPSGIRELDDTYKLLQIASSVLPGVVEEIWPEIVRALDKNPPVSKHFKSRRNHALEVLRQVKKKVLDLRDTVEAVEKVIKGLKE